MGPLSSGACGSGNERPAAASVSSRAGGGGGGGGGACRAAARTGRRSVTGSRAGVRSLRTGRSRSGAGGLAGRESRAAGLALAPPFAGAVATGSRAGLLGRAMADNGLSAETSAQYCSSESWSHSVLGQSSSSSRLPGRGELHRRVVARRVGPGRAEVHGRVVGRGEVVGMAPRGAGVIAPARRCGRGDGRAGRLLAVAGRVGPGRPARRAVVTAAAGVPLPGRAARAVTVMLATAAGGAAPRGRGHPPGIPLPPPLVLVAAPVAATGPHLRLVVLITAPEPNAQKDRNEDYHDYGHQADHEQDHRTTQLAMAIWAALARRTRPRRGPSPVSLATWVTTEGTPRAVILADRYGPCHAFRELLLVSFTHCNLAITD